MAPKYKMRKRNPNFYKDTLSAILLVQIYSPVIDMKKILLTIMTAGLSCHTICAQTHKREEAKPVETFRQTDRTKPAFDKDQYIYFPDYYAFYDPERGYVFWNEETSSWKTSLEPPKFMNNTDMSRTRIQILDGLDLDLRPEQNYPNYMKLYPARNNDPKIPVPNGRRSSESGF